MVLWFSGLVVSIGNRQNNKRQNNILSIDIFFVQSVKSGRLLVENAANKITKQQNNISSIDIYFFCPVSQSVWKTVPSEARVTRDVVSGLQI